MLGGTDFVGPAVVEAALARGDDVTVFHRGRTGAAPPGAREVLGDRTNAPDLEALAAQEWDVVVDTWPRAPRVVLAAARALQGSAERYVYISSVSVYRDEPGGHLTETSAVVDADPDADSTEYPADKRGAELAIESVFGADRSLFARPGLILGPHENIGRLAWWLRRIAAGGEVLAPGPAANGLQYVDARDLAAFVIDTDLSGAVNVLSPPGHTTMADLLALCAEATGSSARLTWVDAGFLLARGVAPWIELPIWVPPVGDMATFYETDSSLARRSGLRSRSARDTVSDTWSWLRDNPGWTQVVVPNRARVGLEPARERELLDAWADQPPAAR